MSTRRFLIRTAGLAGATGLALTALAPTAYAAGPVDVTNTETVQAYLSPDGNVREARIYEQLALEGRGTATISNPVATDGLRNLDSFGGFQVVNGKLETTQQVDGQSRLRTVSNYDAKKIPLKVKVSYRLDGKPVTANQLVGRSGTVEVRYVVENVTGRDTTFKVDDGTGTMVERTEKVVVPMVGQLQTTLPSNFTDVRSGEASMAGDGRGGTKMSFTMTLFGPIGNPRAEFGYTARIQDGSVPPATISGLPVNPLQSPSFKAGAASFQGGAKSGRDLSSGAAEIDANLIKLRDGGNELLAGLVKLRQGSADLHKGLASDAAPGAHQLADGAGQLKDGTVQLKEGTGQLVDGTVELKNGTARLKNGAVRLADGTGQLKDGTAQLKDGTAQLKDGTVQLREGTIKLKDGTIELKNGTAQLKDGAVQLLEGTIQLKTGTVELKEGTVKLRDGSGRLVEGSGKLRNGALELDSGAGQLHEGLGQAKASAPELIAGLQRVSDGLKDLDSGLVKMHQEIGGLPEKAKPLHEGIQKLRAGIGSTTTDGTLLHGVDQLRTQVNEGANGLLTVTDKVYKPAQTKDAAGAYQKIDCAVRVAKQLKDGGYGTNADGSARTSFDPFCYGDKKVLLDGLAALGSTAPESNLVKRQILATLADELTKGRDQLADPDKLGDPNSPAYIDGPKPDPSSATMQQALTYIGGRLKNRAVPGLVKVECGLSGASFGTGASSPCYDPTTKTVKPGVLEGLNLVDDGVNTLVNGVVSAVQTGVGSQAHHDAAKEAARKKQAYDPTDLRGGTGALMGGMELIQAGGSQLMAGMNRLHEGAGKLKTGTGQLSAGATELNSGAGELDAGVGRLDAGAGRLDEGAGKLKDGAGRLVPGAEKLNAGAGRLANGAEQLDAGAGRLQDGSARAHEGAARLSDGAARLDKGAGELKDGAGQLDAGVARLKDGATKLDGGANKLDDGATRLDAGANKLATGLDKAADGSRQIAEGTEKAAEGGAKIPDGANQLHEKGSTKLMAAGKNTSIDYGVKYAAIEAGAQRADHEAMPIGAPAGAQGLTAYSLEIDGIDGSASRNVGQGLAGLGMFAAAAAAAVVKRRLA